LKLEEIDIEKGEAKVVEKDKSGEIINEYPIQLDYGEWAITTASRILMSRLLIMNSLLSRSSYLVGWRRF
jgi:hypothetical protein